MKIQKEIVEYFKHWIEVPVVEELTEFLDGTGCPVIVTDEDIKRHYYRHPEDVEQAIIETMGHFGEPHDSPLGDFLESWFRRLYSVPQK